MKNTEDQPRVTSVDLFQGRDHGGGVDVAMAIGTVKGEWLRGGGGRGREEGSMVRA